MARTFAISSAGIHQASYLRRFRGLICSPRSGPRIWPLSALIAAVSTHFEFAADANGLHLLVASGWPPDRATQAFRSFLAESPNRTAGS